MNKKINAEKKVSPKIDFNKKLDEKLIKYEALTSRALNEIKTNKGLSDKEGLIAMDFLSMARNYFSDAKYFKEKGELLTALAAFSYAHAWLDAGVRAGLFIATNDQLFTIP